MKIETALTAFCITTLMLIVGLVALTASELGIVNPAFVGNYLGIPGQGEVSRASLPFAMPNVDPEDPVCYTNGINECSRTNSGVNLLACTERVAVECGRTDVMMRTCFLPPGFELKYASSQDCRKNIGNDCLALCPSSSQKDCYRVSAGRCSLIGGRFQAVYQQTKYSDYPLVEPGFHG